MTSPIEDAAIAVAEEAIPEVEQDLKTRFESFLSDHAKLHEEVQGIHHFLTVFADHLKSRGVDLTAQLPKAVTADDLEPADNTEGPAPAAAQ